MFFPSVGVNAAGKAVIAFSIAGEDFFPSAGYSVLDAANGAGPRHFLCRGRADRRLQRLFRFRVGRWGDYSWAVSDEADNIWTGAEVIPAKSRFRPSLPSRTGAHDMETVLAALHEDVIWANGLEGGHVYGREGVRNYWTRLWATVDPHVEPVAFAEGPKSEVIVEVHQVVRDLRGNLLADRMIGHIFRVENGLVRRLDIRGA